MKRSILSKIQNRTGIAFKQAYLNVKWRIHRRTVWIKYAYMTLPFHGDGDRQEVFYHLNGKEWWNNELAILSKHIKSGNVAVDVGANLGFLTGLASGLVGPEGHVHSFEPSPTTYAKLKEVIAANHYVNVASYNVGCGESEGNMTLHCAASSGHATLHSPSNVVQGIWPTQEVRIVRLDDFFAANLHRLDFLKIDTEGFEDCVLAGAVGLLQKFKPIVYIELTSEYHTSSQRAVKILRENGYLFEREPILEESHNGDNYIAFHKSKQSQ